MMGTIVLGWVLIVIGVVATMAGVAGGIAAMCQQIRKRAGVGESFGLQMLPTEFLKALTELVNALVRAPVWLALIIIGFALIAWGGTMLPTSMPSYTSTG